jgi:hypothetical protein
MKSAASFARQWFAQCLFVGLLFAAGPAMAQSATLSYAEGAITLLRGPATYTAATGARLDAGDMIQTGPKGQAQLEFADGLILNLGADSKLYLLAAGGPGKPMQFALAEGWLKAAMPAKRKGDARPLEYLLPAVTVETADATLVLHATADTAEVFDESGSAKISETAHDGTAGKSITTKASDYASRKGEEPLAAGRPLQAFLTGMPRHYRDNLPPLAAKVKEAREPVRDHDTSYAEAKAWLNGNALVRAGLAARYQPRVKDTEFHDGLVADMSLHPEWERMLGGAKAAPKKK